MSALEQYDLPDEPNTVIVRPMLTPTQAVDLFLGDLNRRSRSKTGRTASSYARLLDKLTDSLRTDQDVADITSDDCRRFLDKYARHAPGYQHTIYSTLNSFFEWLYLQQRIKRNPLDFIPRPRRIAAEDLDVITVSTSDVARMLASCDTASERLALSILAYLGPRRHAVAMLRLSDYDRDEGLMRFREKGTKVVWKPMPVELVDILERAIVAGDLANPWQPEDPYLVPPEGPLQKAARDDRCIWRLVKKIADGVGIDAHVHALRAAFATFYLESGGDLLGAQELLGHASADTTRVYLRKLNKRRAMEPVRTLSWAGVATGNKEPAGITEFPGNRFASSPVVGAGGFEPPHSEPGLPDRPHSQPQVDESIVDALEARIQAPEASEVQS